MDEFEVSYSLDNEQQFWDELEDIVTVSCGNDHQLIDNALRSYLHFTSNFKNDYLTTEYDIARCSSSLLNSELFIGNKEYVRLQLVFSLLQEDDTKPLHIIASLLLYAGRHDEETFEIMNNEGCFARLLECIKTGRSKIGPVSDVGGRDQDDEQETEGWDAGLHRLLLELLYEMSRVQRLSPADLNEIDDAFVMSLFQIIEELSDDVDDPYHYPVIRVLLVLNEQYMVASTNSTASHGTTGTPPTNRVVKVLSIHGSRYMTFGENIIILLNRETETSLQLLILKLLYLLFTTKATHEYFYTNDLRVLLDVIIRNLLDLPNELISLRHTYLRVLYPLLAYTQLSQAPHYKRDEIRKTLSILGGAGNFHFAPADETTLRLVERVAQVPWLRDEDISDGDVAKKLLGISLSPSQSASSISVIDVVAVTAEPGVLTPSRAAEEQADAAANAVDEDGAKPKAIEIAGEGVLEGVKLSDPMERQRRAAPAPPTPRIQVNGNKKLPPKAPPRRRTKLKTSVSNTETEG